MTDHIEEAMKIADEWCPEYRHGLGGDIAAALAEKDKRIAELERERDAADHKLVDRYRNPKTGTFSFPGDVAAIVRRLVVERAEAARLRALLAEAREVMKPFATGLAKTTHTNQCRHHGGHDCDCCKDDYLRAALALAEKLEKETGNE